MQANLDRLSKDQEEHRKSLAEEKSKAEQLTIEREDAQAKWKEEKDKSASVMSDLRMKIDSLTTTIALQKEDAKAMELELTKARFDRDAFEEDAKTLMVRIRVFLSTRTLVGCPWPSNVTSGSHENRGVMLGSVN